MTLPNALQTTSTIRMARNCRSSYGGKRNLSLLELQNSRRLMNSKTVERVAEARPPTDLGEFRLIGYRSFNNYDWKTEVLAASIRHPIHVIEAARIGADVATMPFKVMAQLINHPLTHKGLEQFLADWRKAA